MCSFCSSYEEICLGCGNIKGNEYSVIPHYASQRRDLKNLVNTSSEENFVWVLLYRGTPVKVGCGGLRKLYNETLPNPRYCKFDTAIIYYCSDKWIRNELATWLSGKYSESIVNRQGWANAIYCKSSDLIMPPNCTDPIVAFGDPDFYIGDTPYWDMTKLYRIGIKRRRLVL